MTSPSPDSPRGDWDVMHDALTHRVHAMLASTLSASGAPKRTALALGTHALALECATALAQLKATMEADREERRNLLRELSESQDRLARIQRDFADSQAGELQARHLSLHDELTTLPNRRNCRERLSEALSLASARRTTAALLFLDLDGFKAINDRLGHETGDEVLRIVAARLSRAVRAGDIVCRLGGDEFVCLPNGPMEPSQLAHLARKLFDAVSAPMAFHNVHLVVQPSIGVAVYPTHASDTESLLSAADAAMYRAKRARTGVAFAECSGGGEPCTGLMPHAPEK
jgi:diguanylate cyclase